MTKDIYLEIRNLFQRFPWKLRYGSHTFNCYMMGKVNYINSGKGDRNLNFTPSSFACLRWHLSIISQRNKTRQRQWKVALRVLTQQDADTLMDEDFYKHAVVRMKMIVVKMRYKYLFKKKKTTAITSTTISSIWCLWLKKYWFFSFISIFWHFQVFEIRFTQPIYFVIACSL